MKVQDFNYLKRMKGLVTDLEDNIELYNTLAAQDKAVIEAITIIYEELNNGQQKKLIKNDKVRELFDRYGLKYAEE